MFTALLPRLAGIEFGGTPSSMKSIFVGGIKSLPIRYELADASHTAIIKSSHRVPSARPSSR
jgi:hypothetical protein